MEEERLRALSSGLWGPTAYFELVNDRDPKHSGDDPDDQDGGQVSQRMEHDDDGVHWH